MEGLQRRHKEATSQVQATTANQTREVVNEHQQTIQGDFIARSLLSQISGTPLSPQDQASLQQHEKYLREQFPEFGSKLEHMITLVETQIRNLPKESVPSDMKDTLRGLYGA